MLLSSKNDGLCPSLSMTQRMYGFVGCFCIGCLISVLSSFALIRADVVQFAILYSIGNLVALCSTGFLWGPKSQVKKMFKQTRLVATVVYLVCIVATLVIACADLGIDNGGKVALCLVLIVIQFLALCWYCLSFIPYGRKMALNCLTGCCK